jgi:hypothetical protein
MARKLRKGKVSPLDPGKQIKKTEAAKRKVARNDAKDKAPPKGKKAKAKTKAKPKTKAKAKAKVGTPKIAGALGVASRAGPAVLASVAAAGGGVKLISEIFSRVTSGGKPKQYQDYGWEKYSKSRARLSKAAGKQPGPVGEFSQVSERKARKKTPEKPSPGSDIMAGRGKVMTIQPEGERAYQAGYETARPLYAPLVSSTPKTVTKKTEVGKVKDATTLHSDISKSRAIAPVKIILDEKRGPVKAKKAVKPAAKEEPAPTKTKPVAKKKEATTTTKKGKLIPPRKPKSEFFSSTRKAIRTGTEAPKLTASARGGLLKKPLVATEPFNLEAPSSKMKTAQRLDFDKFNKSSSKLGRTMDDALRRFFSFMPGVLPQSTDDSKWIRKRK